MRRQKGFERLAVTDFIKITIGFDYLTIDAAAPHTP